jgi:hypothetical protein
VVVEQGGRRGGIVGLLACAALLAAAASPSADARRSNDAAGGTIAPATAASACSRATAARLVRRHRLNPFLLRQPVAQVLCGPFAGPGSRAMAITVGPAPTCWPIQNWAVFELVGGVWRVVLKRTEFVAPPLVAAGSAIRETVPVHRSGDARCTPSGGTRTIIWRWNGSRLVATGANQTEHLTSFLSPDRQVWCVFTAVAPLEADCGGPPPSSRQPPPPAHAAELKRSGALTVCNADVCFQNWDFGAPLLRLGQTNLIHGFRCAARADGITCTVDVGAARGKGFRINTEGVTRIGGP